MNESICASFLSKMIHSGSLCTTDMNINRHIMYNNPSKVFLIFRLVKYLSLLQVLLVLMVNLFTKLFS